MSALVHKNEFRTARIVTAGVLLLALLGAAARRIPALTSCGGTRGGASCACGPL